MGTSLNGLTPAGTYPGLIKTGDNAPIDGTLKTLSDGNGNNLPMAVSTTAVNFTNQLQQSGVAVPTASQVAAKQDTLVSGTNIKTINGTSVLGSGDIVTPYTPPSGVSGAIQFSNGSAFASDASNLFWDDTNNRLGVGTNAPAAILQAQNSTTGLLLARFKDAFASTSFIDIKQDSTLTDYTGLYWSNEYRMLSRAGGTTFLNVSNNVVFADGFLAKTTITPSEVRIGEITGARVGIKGSGSTSATTSLLVQNSAGRSSLQVLDDTSVFNYGGGSVITNTAYGQFALQNNSTGSKNVALSYGCLLFNTTGSNNTAVGFESLRPNTTGSNNTAVGDGTRSGDFSGSLILGKDATATANNQFVVGSSTTNAGAVNSTSDVPATFLWSVRINGTNYKILMTT